MPADSIRLRGTERYEKLVEICRGLGVVTPEDPYPVWPGPRGRRGDRAAVPPVRLQLLAAGARSAAVLVNPIRWSASRCGCCGSLSSPCGAARCVRPTGIGASTPWRWSMGTCISDGPPGTMACRSWRFRWATRGSGPGAAARPAVPGAAPAGGVTCSPNCCPRRCTRWRSSTTHRTRGCFPRRSTWRGRWRSVDVSSPPAATARGRRSGGSVGHRRPSSAASAARPAGLRLVMTSARKPLSRCRS